MAAVSFGYIFLICGIIIISLACCSTFFEYRIAYIITVVVAGFSLGIVASIAAFFGYINPDKCNEYELYLILGLFSNTTYPPLEEWKLENRCLEPADCLVPAHNYIQTKCRTPFTVNLSVECASVALIIIVSICTSLTQCVLPQDEHTPVEV
ncbi:hypothetical protein TRFO_32045 [Tritrichomonas foetus]|uniref:Uncharacterized protein n=1 Tax=Tritrichomonas foetus TaxID=1144522 RepID=A0A1J4JUL3_9EUKA|nr:hypothetical protein TRFO_32045 [Tritrichomonas foetus]|eukprot:OHT01212.1 hypothetical protein TRFO_32045 [Tritrichomonas foetus]